MLRNVDDFSSWREQAREFLHQGVAPEESLWLDPQEQLFEPEFLGSLPILEPRVPREFLQLGQKAACFRHPSRWGLLYRVLWRLNTGEPHLLQVASDPDLAKLRGMVSAVERDIHKMHAFVRFRRTEDDTYVAWHEPAHLVVKLASPFFSRRFASIRWSILTPDCCAYWNGEELLYGPGVTREQAPQQDDTEELWKTYYAHIFNPARVKISAMVSEMPKRHWKTLPETVLIPEMLAQAEARVEEMLRYTQEEQAAHPGSRDR